jgi:hypothetical protein
MGRCIFNAIVAGNGRISFKDAKSIIVTKM